jgi:lipid-A-disaccharide synthase
VVTELIQHGMSRENLQHELSAILPGGDKRQALLAHYDRLRTKIGEPGASLRVAREIVINYE